MCFALLVYAGAGLWVAAHASATSDEVPHIGAGVAYLQGDFRLNREHPPLVKLLAAAALPAAAYRFHLPAANSGGPSADALQWSFGSAILHAPGQVPLALLLRARLPLLVLNASLFGFLALWAHAAFGAAAACWALLLLAGCPLWLAHASLVTTDAPATCFFFGCAACADRLLFAQGRARACWAAALAGLCALALATKYSLVAVLGLVPLAFALDAWRSGRSAQLPWCFGAAAVGGAAGCALSWGLPADPLAYVRGIQQVGHNHHTQGYAYYAFGSLFVGQDPLYFARALLVKASAGTLLGAALAAGLALSRRLGRVAPPSPARERSHALLWLPPLGYYALMAGFAPAIGVRYVLPVLPFLLLAAGAGLAACMRQAPLRWLLAALCALQLYGLAAALRATPLAYFNGFFCFTGDAPPCLDDSNVDWGQGLPQLEAARAERYADAALRIFYFGSSPPGAYVRGAQVAAPTELLQPQPALYAVSLHVLARAPDASWVRRAAPREIVAGSYALFDLRGLAR